MINSVSLGNISNTKNTTPLQIKKQEVTPAFGKIFSLRNSKNISNVYQQNPIRTRLTESEQHLYTEIVKAVSNSANEDKSVHSDKYTQAQKLNILLMNGKLLNSSSNDGTTTLENLYKILSTERIKGFSNVKLLNQTIDAIFDPTIITQKFGDIPTPVKSVLSAEPAIVQTTDTNLKSINVDEVGSGTCAATSIEYNMANKMPAEFARWANELSSPKYSVSQNVKSSALSKNPLETLELFKYFKFYPNKVNFDSYNFELRPDNNAILRAYVQNEYYDSGERSVIDVLMQSTIMNMGSRGKYNSLNDARHSDDVAEGLQEHEKTFMESIIANKEKLTLTYMTIAPDNETIQSRRCSNSKIEKHLKDALSMGEDVIIGYRDTYQGNVFWHEITISGMKKDKLGRTVFLCNDTDDNKNQLFEWKASDLIPKIHHATYPAQLVENEYTLI